MEMFLACYLKSICDMMHNLKMMMLLIIYPYNQ